MSGTLQQALEALRDEHAAISGQLTAIETAMESIEGLLRRGDAAPAARRPAKPRKAKAARKPRKQRAAQAGSVGVAKRAPSVAHGHTREAIEAWRRKALAPALKHPKGSPARAEATAKLVGSTVPGIDGGPDVVLMKTSVFVWLKQFDEA